MNAPANAVARRARHGSSCALGPSGTSTQPASTPYDTARMVGTRPLQNTCTQSRWPPFLDDSSSPSLASSLYWVSLEEEKKKASSVQPKRRLQPSVPVPTTMAAMAPDWARDLRVWPHQAMPREPSTAADSCTARPKACDATSSTLMPPTMTRSRTTLTARGRVLGGVALGSLSMPSREVSACASASWARASACATVSAPDVAPLLPAPPSLPVPVLLEAALSVCVPTDTDAFRDL
mmetsp:Transcript_37499/g.94660  ORF Transcript_37499/g.94660 Transcript_37499/m.94660 type:complete len:236 (-) Transcript_37499:731-1438(-)